jgi:hypothetical protein
MESGSAIWQIFGTYQSDGAPLGDFYIDLNRSYDREPGKSELAHHMNMVFYTMVGVTTLVLILLLIGRVLKPFRNQPKSKNPALVRRNRVSCA